LFARSCLRAAVKTGLTLGPASTECTALAHEAGMAQILLFRRFQCNHPPQSDFLEERKHPMFKRVSGLNIIAASLALIPAFAMAQETQVVKIGFSSPLTGPQASAGKDNQGGLMMAVERLNAQPITVGGKKIKFEVIAEDDQADPRAWPWHRSWLTRASRPSSVPTTRA
jgi:hypothetical protein